MNGLLHVSTLLSPCELMFPGLFSLENWIPSGRSTSTRILVQPVEPVARMEYVICGYRWLRMKQKRALREKTPT